MKISEEGIKILVIDSRPIFRSGLENTLQRNFQVVASVNWSEVNEALCTTLMPDIVIVSNYTVDSSLYSLFTRLKAYASECHLILVAEQYTNCNVSSLLASGCDCCLMSTISDNELIQCITCLSHGIFFFDFTAIRQLKSELQMQSNAPDLPKSLSQRMPLDRELQIAQMIFQGNSNQEIAKKMYLSTGTIKNIISTILAKYSLKSRSQIVGLLFANTGKASKTINSL